MNDTGKLVKMEKAEVLKSFFNWVFNGSFSSHAFQEDGWQDGGAMSLPL